MTAHAHVVRREGESFDNLLHRFRKQVAESHMLPDVKHHLYHTKPGDLHRMKQAKGIRAWKEKRRKLEERLRRGE